jgi:branched-chain amino acid transport system ATP-binding protein
MTPSALTLRNLRVSYGKAPAVRGATLEVEAGSITALIGPNGAGKSSTFQAVMGVVPSESDEMTLHGRSLLALSPTERVKAGLVFVPQGRQLFRTMSVADNLAVVANAFGISRGAVGEALNRFPILKERQAVPAGALSGGEQQMLALARALMCSPSVLVLDEPTLGLAPTIVKDVIDVLLDMRNQGKSIVIAEPTTRTLPRQLDRGYVLIRGRIAGQAGNIAGLESAFRSLYQVQDRAR